MILYHGTTQQLARHIKRTGLHPNIEQAMRVKNMWRDGRMIPDVGQYAYLTTELYTAEVFADFRTAYEQAMPGQQLTYEAWSGDSPYYKASDAPQPNPSAKPAVLVFTIPDLVEFGLAPDPALPAEMGNYRTPKPIPAEYITRVISKEN